MSATVSHYKKDVISRMGGEPNYSMAIFQLSERLLQDPKLRDFYGSVCEVQDLYEIQKQVLDLALVDMYSETREKAFTRVMLYHYRLFALGLNESHFNAVKEHLRNVLQFLWVEPDVINDILSYYEELRQDLFLAKKQSAALQTRQ